MSTVEPQTHSTHVDVTKLGEVVDTGSEIYDEEECGTDNDEEVKHDMVKCEKCGVTTHYSVGECGNENCKTKFKMSKSGYLVSGEDGNFVCDEDEEIEYMTSDDDDVAMDEETCSEDEGGDAVDEEEDEDEFSDSSDEDDMDMIIADDEDEYVYKKSDGAVVQDPSLRRVTRRSSQSHVQ